MSMVAGTARSMGVVVVGRRKRDDNVGGRSAANDHMGGKNNMKHGKKYTDSVKADRFPEAV